MISQGGEGNRSLNTVFAAAREAVIKMSIYTYPPEPETRCTKVPRSCDLMVRSHVKGVCRTLDGVNFRRPFDALLEIDDPCMTSGQNSSPMWSVCKIIIAQRRAAGGLGSKSSIAP